uniref:Regulator of SigK n=1 Tax=Streptomyces sp. NBC_00049 TaxID=2903617 RepID=A0AAU2JIG4_9ACTN
MNTADLHTLTGAYVLDALESGERTAVERHLTDCPSCAQEVRELSETVTRLGLAASVPPTAALRDAVLRRIATVRQEPPPTVPLPRRRGLVPPRFRRLSHWALAACLAGAAGLGVLADWQYGQAEEARQQARQARSANDAVAAVLAAPDARMSTSRLRSGAVGTVVVSAARNQAVFAASGMPAPPAGKVYQLWYNDAGRMRSAGLIAAGGPSTATLLDGPVGRASGMGVTVEPDGGSPQPTSAPVALLAFPKA